MFAKSNKKLSVDSMAYLLIKQCEVGFRGECFGWFCGERRVQGLFGLDKDN